MDGAAVIQINWPLIDPEGNTDPDLFTLRDVPQRLQQDASSMKGLQGNLSRPRRAQSWKDLLVFLIFAELCDWTVPPTTKHRDPTFLLGQKS